MLVLPYIRSVDYLVNGKTYGVSYQDLRERHIALCETTDADFLAKLPEALHLACIIAWFKEMPSQHVLSDEGVIHQLVHLLHIPGCELVVLADVRKQFAEDLKLA